MLHLLNFAMTFYMNITNLKATIFYMIKNIMMGARASSNVSKHSVPLQEEISKPHIFSVKCWSVRSVWSVMVCEGLLNHLYTVMYVVVRKLFKMLKNFMKFVLRILQLIMLKMINQYLIGYSFIYHLRK